MAPKKPAAPPSAFVRHTPAARDSHPPTPAAAPANPSTSLAASTPSAGARTARPAPAARAGLRALVPSAVRADGESDPFLHAYKTRWLSKLDFTSSASVESLLLLAVFLLAHARSAEAERVVDNIIRHVDARRASPGVRAALVTALRLSAWLKAKRGVDAARFVAHARALDDATVSLDREWLSVSASEEVRAALVRGKASYVVGPLAGIARWLTDPGARTRAEALLDELIDALRPFMREGER